MSNLIMMTEAEFLEHAGVKGMKWGIRKEEQTTHRERLENKYRIAMTETEAKAKADARIRTEKAVAIVGAVVITTAVAVIVGKKLHTEYMPINLNEHTVLQNVNQHGKDFDLNRVTFATYTKGDNKIYRDKFAKELLMRPGRQSDDIFATTLKPIKDIRIPSKAKAKALFEEWEIVSNGGLAKSKSKLSTTTRMINNNRGRQVGGQATVNKDSFLSYVASKGYDGVQDVMDQNSSHFRAKTPLIFANGVNALTVAGAESISNMNLNTMPFK